MLLRRVYRYTMWVLPLPLPRGVLPWVLVLVLVQLLLLFVDRCTMPLCTLLDVGPDRSYTPPLIYPFHTPHSTLPQPHFKASLLELLGIL